MNWTAIVPFKTEGARKTRLADRLSMDERAALGLQMFRHVTDVLSQCSNLDRVIVLSGRRPPDWAGAWAPDKGRGLNSELTELRTALATHVVVVHADLPLLTTRDIVVLLSAATEHGIAIGPDRHGAGTNGLAIQSGIDFDFHFGQGSFRLHKAQAPACAVVRRKGLGVDLDTPHDLEIVKLASEVRP